MDSPGTVPRDSSPGRPPAASTSSSPTSSPRKDPTHSRGNVRQPRSLLSPEKTRMMCAFIKQLCKRLKLRSVTMCSALVFFHRFQAKRAEATGGMQFDDHDMAIACVFLASKVEENTQHLKVILDAAHHLRTNDDIPLSKDEKRMWEMRESILLCERILLDTMAFNVTVEHSHPQAGKFAAKVSADNKEEARDLQQAASNILNDSLSTNMCLKYTPSLIGAAAVLLAAKYLKAKSQHREFFEKIAKMEASGQVFGFPLKDLIEVEVELISTYEPAGEGASSSPSIGPSKRVRVDSLESLPYDL